MVGAYGLYTHIRRNEIRSRAMVGLLFGFVLVLAYALALLARATGLHPGGAPGLGGSLRAAAADLVWIGPLVLAGTFLWLFLAYRYHQALIDRVVKANDAAGALARLGAAPPDLILLAGSVPDMELLDLCAALRREPSAEKTPFVLVAGAAAQTGRAASQTGADLVFPPTVGPTEIADRLRRLF